MYVVAAQRQDIEKGEAMTFDRRSFLLAGAGAALSGAAGGCTGPSPDVASGRRTDLTGRFEGFKPLDLRRIRIEVGARRPFKAVQLTDSHFVRVDASENDPRKLSLSAMRLGMMGYGEHYTTEAMAFARRENALLLHTGDMIDFVSNANLDLVRRYFGSADWFVAAGNHEYSRYVGEAREDAAYKAVSFERVQAAFPNDLVFASRTVNGVNFVALDDNYYKITEKQLALMEKEVAKGLPIVLMCHIPFHLPLHYAEMMKKTGGRCPYETGVPHSLVDTWKAPERPLAEGEEWRDCRVSHRADAATLEFIAYLKTQPLLKAVLCGHTHRFWQERFSPSSVQYVSAATYQGGGYLIDFV